MFLSWKAKDLGGKNEERDVQSVSDSLGSISQFKLRVREKWKRKQI